MEQKDDIAEAYRLVRKRTEEEGERIGRQLAACYGVHYETAMMSTDPSIKAEPDDSKDVAEGSGETPDAETENQEGKGEESEARKGEAEEGEGGEGRED